MKMERICKYSLRYRKCGVRGYMHELSVSKTRTSKVQVLRNEILVLRVIKRIKATIYLIGITCSVLTSKCISSKCFLEIFVVTKKL